MLKFAHLLQSAWRSSRQFAELALQSIRRAFNVVYPPILLLTIAFCIYGLLRTPSPGLAIGALGFAGVIVALKEKMGPSHRFLWALVTFALLVIEVRAIIQDRTEQFQQHIYELGQQREAQAQTLTSALLANQAEMSQNQSQFEATSARMNEAMNQLTGGDSFCYVDFMDLTRGPTVVHEGKYPLHGVRVTVKNMGELKRRLDRAVAGHPEELFLDDYTTDIEVPIPIGELSPGQAIPMEKAPILDVQDSQEKRLDFIFSASNGYFVQHTCFKRATNSVAPRYLLVTATQVEMRGKVRKTDIFPTYPRDANGQIDCFEKKQQAAWTAATALQSPAPPQKAQEGQTVQETPKPFYEFMSPLTFDHKNVLYRGQHSVFSLGDSILIKNSQVEFDGIDFVGQYPGAYIWVTDQNSNVLIRNSVIKNMSQQLDLVTWVDVRFENSHILYSGGPLRLANVAFKNCDLSGIRSPELIAKIREAQEQPITFTLQPRTRH